jgi:hypothetical protein
LFHVIEQTKKKIYFIYLKYHKNFLSKIKIITKEEEDDRPLKK